MLSKTLLFKIVGIVHPIYFTAHFYLSETEKIKDLTDEQKSFYLLLIQQMMQNPC